MGMDFKLPILERQRARGGDFRSKDTGGRGREISILSLIFLGLLLVVFVRLFQVTVVQGAYYARLSEDNRIREMTIEARRGTITDRQGRPLAYNDDAELASTSARLGSVRRYVDGLMMGHIIGYRQQADAQDLDNDPCIGKLALGDKTGKKGVEKVFECELRGRHGKKMVEYDAHGTAQETLAVTEPVAGQDVRLAIDSGLQKAAYDAIATTSAKLVAESKKPIRKSGIIATDPNTGELLAFLSTPSFNPQDFEDQTEEVSRLLKNPDQPLFSRVAEAAYPPGSIFKIIVAAGALEEKAVTPQTLIQDNGFIKAGPSIFHNWYYTEYGRTDGQVDVYKALQRSNDIYFYKTGEKMGELAIKKWSERFGLGNKTSLPLEQTAGVLPSPFWKEETLGEDWYLGDTYNYSIGQGYLLTSPLQIHQAETVISSMGAQICDPQLLANPTPHCRRIKIAPTTVEVVKHGMKLACESGGTGWPLFNFAVKGHRIEVGCKTGTAEAHGNNDPEPHAWFTVFAPYESPAIHITVLIENGGQGSDAAAPIAKAMLEQYFTQSDRYKQFPNVEPVATDAPIIEIRE